MKKPNPVYKFPIFNCEEFAPIILNWIIKYSKIYKEQDRKTEKFEYLNKFLYKRLIDSPIQDYDLINQEGDGIEVKTTCRKTRYRLDIHDFHTDNQINQKIMKFLVDDSKLSEGIITIKFDLIKLSEDKKHFKSIWKEFLEAHQYKDIEDKD